MSLNRITIMGRLVRDPELRRTGSGVAVTRFRIAVDSDYKDGNGNKKTVYVDCQAWRTSAEYICKYFTKGRMIVVDGKLDQDEWTDKENNKRSGHLIIVDSAYFGDSKKDDNQSAPTGNYAGNNPNYGAQQSGYAPAPQQGGYAPAPQQSGYAPAPQQGGFAPAPQQGGYGTPNGWASPTAPGNFVMLDDDDAQLPF